MTVRDQLATLFRLFPNATELAVSTEMVARYEEEWAETQRYCSIDLLVFKWYPVEQFPEFTAQQLPLMFRHLPLTLVAPRLHR